MKQKTMIRVRSFMIGILFLVTAATSMLSTAPALAASPVRQFLTVTGATCSTSSAHIEGQFTKDVEVSSVELITLRVNGQIILSSGSHTIPPAHLAGGWQLTWNIPYSYPYRWEWEWLYTVNGKEVWRNTAGFVCNNGIPATFVTNGDLSVTSVTWFNPGDNRVDPRPGDRIAVYCDRLNEVTVLGVADDLPSYMSGFPLATFSYKDIVAAGERGLTRDAGQMGTVSISLIKGWFWVTWNGGKYKATGQDIFTKNFADDTWCTLAHHN